MLSKKKKRQLKRSLNLLKKRRKAFKKTSLSNKTGRQKEPTLKRRSASKI